LVFFEVLSGLKIGAKLVQLLRVFFLRRLQLPGESLFQIEKLI